MSTPSNTTSSSATPTVNANLFQNLAGLTALLNSNSGAIGNDPNIQQLSAQLIAAMTSSNNVGGMFAAPTVPPALPTNPATPAPAPTMTPSPAPAPAPTATLSSVPAATPAVVPAPAPAPATVTATQAQGAAGDQPENAIQVIERPPGEAGNGQTGFILQEKMHMDDADYNFFLATVRKCAIRAGIDFTRTYIKQDRSVLDHACKLCVKEIPYVTKKRFPNWWPILEAIKHQLRNRRKYVVRMAKRRAAAGDHSGGSGSGSGNDSD